MKQLSILDPSFISELHEKDDPILLAIKSINDDLQANNNVNNVIGLTEISTNQEAGNPKEKSTPAFSDEAIGVHPKRFFLLGIFFVYALTNSFQWIQYAIITNLVVDFYKVSPTEVNWTSTLYMAVFVVFLIPCSWLQEKKGLRFVMVLGSILNCLGAVIKCFSVAEGRFYLSMMGQFLPAIAQTFILSTPAHLGSVWFGADEVSRACAIGATGTQVGIALGFFLPPLIVRPKEIAWGLQVMFSSVAALTTLVAIVTWFGFDARPPRPPSRAQAELPAHSDYWRSMKKLFTCKPFILLMVSFGLNAGAFSALSTILNQLIVPKYPDGGEQIAGGMGLAMVLAGSIGMFGGGWILDRTHRFHRTILALHVCTTVFFAALTAAEELYAPVPLLYALSALLGIFMNSNFPVGFEMAAELTYPEVESTTSGLLNVSAQLLGTLVTIAAGAALENFGTIWPNVILGVILGISVISASMIKGKLLRLEASRKPTSVV